MDAVDQKAYDDGLRWRLEVLLAKFEAGEIKFAPEVFKQMEASLRAVRALPDGTVDLNTVDGPVRSLAAVTAGLHMRQKEKEAASLEDIANAYFKLIEENCGFFVEEANCLGSGLVKSEPKDDGCRDTYA